VHSSNYTAVIELEIDLGQCLDEADAYAAAEEEIYMLKETDLKIQGATILDVEQW
jgi:hypothetical protein